MLGVKVDENAIMAALEERMSFITKYAELAKLMAADPSPISGEIALIPTFPTFMAFNTGYKYANDALDALIKDASERVTRGEGIVPKGSPRGMAWTIPFCNPFVSSVFEENGVAMPYSEGFLPSKAELEPPTYTDHLRLMLKLC